MSIALHIVPSGSGSPGTSTDLIDLVLIAMLWFGSLFLVTETRRKRTLRGIILPAIVIGVASTGLILSYVVLPSYLTPQPPQGSVYVTIWPGSYKPAGTSPTEQPNGFVPQNVTIRLGVNATIAWQNNDTVMHTAHSDTGEFDMGQLQPGQVKWYTFTRPGVFTYHCDPHPWRKGTITVLSS